MKKAFTIVEVVIIAAIILVLILAFLPLTFPRDDTETLQETLGIVSIESNIDNENYYLPRTATNIIDHGNNWWEFTLNGNHWLCHNDGSDQESLTLIPKTIESIPKTIE